MITAPEKFNRHHRREGIELHKIVTITNSQSVTMKFGDSDMILSGETNPLVYGLLRPGSKIRQSVDPWSRRFSIGNVMINLSNAPYDGSYPRKRLSDLWSTFWVYCRSGTVKIYLLAGSDNTLLTDGALVFEGSIIKLPSFDDNYITIEACDIGNNLLNQSVPFNSLKGIGYGTPHDFRPSIVYGNWGYNNNPWGSDRLFIKTSKALSNNRFIADHVLKNCGPLWFNFLDNESLWGHVDTDVTGYQAVDILCPDGKYRTVYQTPSSDYYWIYLFIPPSGLTEVWWSGSLGQSNYNVGSNNIINELNLRDRLDNTYAGLYYNLGYVPSGSEYRGMVTLKWNDIDNIPKNWEVDYLNFDFYWRSDINIGAGTYQYGFASFVKTVVAATCTGMNGDSMTTSSTIHDGTMKYLHPADIGGTPFATYVGWQFGTKGVLMRFPVYINPPGVLIDDIILSIYQAAIGVRVKIPKPTPDIYGYVNVIGQKVGSQIAARQPGLGSEDELDYAAYQIERLLKITFGLSDNQFDNASLDAAYKSYLKTRTNISEDNPVRLGDLLQELSENSNFALFFNVTGKLRVIALDQTPPATANLYIYPDDIDGVPNISSSETEKVINRLNSNWDYRPNDNVYDSGEVRNNTGSQLIYGVKEGDAEFKYYTDQQTAYPRRPLQDILIGTDGFFSKDHQIVGWKSPGYKHSLAEIGDWVEFDAGLDARLKCAGESWSGKKFIIIEKNIDDYYLEFTAIEL